MSMSNKRKRDSTSHTKTLTERINDVLTELELTKDLIAKEYLTYNTGILKQLSEERITILKNAYPRTFFLRKYFLFYLNVKNMMPFRI